MPLSRRPIGAGREKLLDDRRRLVHAEPPDFWLDDTSVLAEGCLLVRAQSAKAELIHDESHIGIKDWSGTNIKKESQGKTRDADSINGP